MADEQSKNNDAKLMEGRAQIIPKDNISEVIGKSKPFKLLKELINNKKNIFLTKKIESFPFKRNVKEPYPIKITPKAMTKDMFISNLFAFEPL